MPRSAPALCLALLGLTATSALHGGTTGYYRQPSIHGDTIVFVAEGDLWRVGVDGGVARRITTHPREETHPALSPDGATIAFVAHYEGPAEVYTMPVTGGRPVRRTDGIDRAEVVGWAPGGDVLCATTRYATLPNWQLVRLTPSRPEATAEPVLVPLAQCADGTYDDRGETLYFTRLPFQGSHTKRYQGGTAQNIWRFADGDVEARPLTADYPGTSKAPMWWQGRVYFASDRDGTMNLWSMAPDGGDLRPHTTHAGWDVKSPALHGGRIVYQLGADLHRYDIAAGRDRRLPITLESDFDQTRERWVDEPMKWLTAVHLSPDADRVVLTARGRVFVAPRRQGRLVEAARTPGVRYRRARFMPDGQRLVALSDETGEVEVWSLPANGVGAGAALTGDATVLRWEALPSPCGRFVAHHDKDFRLFVHDVATGIDRLVEQSKIEEFRDLAWSPDGAWLAYVSTADNMFKRVRLYATADGNTVDATSERWDSFSPAWSPDGKWLYFLSDRNLRSVVGSPWGNYAPEPFLDKKTQVYMVALVAGTRSPFAPKTELHVEEEQEEEDTDEDGDAHGDEHARGDAYGDAGGDEDAGEDAGEGADTDAPAVVVAIDVDGLATRLHAAPVPPGNYTRLGVNEKNLFWQSRRAGEPAIDLQGAEIKSLDFEVKTVVEGITGYELAADGKSMLVRKTDALHVVDAAAKKATLDKKSRVDLSGWKLSVEPREEWRQMFVESWRLERDYFYDPAMHGVDWDAMLAQHLPLVDRVTTREELADLMAQMVSELAALHTYVRPGDTRPGPDDIQMASLGARLTRDAAAGGYRVEHVYGSDPDEPARRSPLAHPEADVRDGDVIVAINGVAALESPGLGRLLRNQAGRQVLLRVQPAAGGEPRDVIVHPMTLSAERDLRYREWEYTRRLAVDEMGNGDVGYVHLRAMSGRNFTEWARDYYPVFNRKGLIVDVRHNRGGNIDSWIIARLLRKAWFYWSQRAGHAPSWNMQYAFRGHVVVLCNERTASDGEAFSEGIKRLELGTLIGTRTWGGEIWLTSSNTLVDRGIATAAEYGVYGPEGAWLIEGWGVEPDIVVDNLPHATFHGRDAQLEAAIAHLKKRLADEPVPDVLPPPHPDKSKR